MKILLKAIKEALFTRNTHIYPQFIAKIKHLWYDNDTKKTILTDCERGERMWYNVTEIARYIITRCSELQRPVSNLKLQKMLYFLWVEFYKKTGRMLFIENIYAWQLGPVVPEVYYEYCSYAGRPIIGVYNSAINSEDIAILNSIIEQYVYVSASELVNRTHARGTAWDSVYRDGAGNRNIIPFDLIIAKEAG